MADDEDDSQKTEDPTPRKLEKAKQKGQTSSSQEIKNWAVLLGGSVMLAALAPWMMMGVTRTSVPFIEQAHDIPLELGSISPLLGGILLELLIYMSPFFGILVLLAIISNVAQTGFIMAPEKIKPDLKKLSMVGGLKRMFSARSLMEFFKGLFKLSVVTLVAYAMAIPFMDDIALMPGYSLMEILDRIYVMSITITAGAAGVMTAIAILDFIYQKYEFTKQMRMSRQEVKDEYKQTEGDPHVKARIRKIRAERAQQRMMQNVPEADVVVTNPTHYAVALTYKMEEMQAPRLVAKGVDNLAFRIREVAEANEVPIVENPPLARALYASVELDEEIPVEHYQAVAEVISFVMQAKTNRRGTRGRGGPTIN